MNKYLLVVLLFPLNVFASDLLGDVKKDLMDEWDAVINGKTSLYVPFRSYHSRNKYKDYKDLNEENYGLGISKSYIDENDNYHSLYVMGFSDSYKHFEPLVGYIYTKRFVKDDMSLGVGVNAVVTARHERDYMPTPGLLPTLSIGYKNIDVFASYVPFYNVTLFWGSYQFD